MRISELATTTGIPIPTIKYYLREGLLPGGRRTAPNQAEYGDEHVHRLRLIRALSDVGGLSLATIRQVLDATDDPSIALHDVFGIAQRSVAGSWARIESSDDLDRARAEVADYLAALGWQVKADAPPRHDLAAALVVLRQLGWEIDTSVFDPYRRAVEDLARWEIDQLRPEVSADLRIEAVVVGTVVFEVVLTALRRLAEEHHSALRFGSGGSA